MFDGIIGVILKAFLGAFGEALNDFFDRRVADKNAKALGRAEAQAEQGAATIEAQQAELQAQADAPRTVDEALARLEDGSA